MNCSFYSFILVVYLQFITYSFGQRRFRNLNSRFRNPHSLAQLRNRSLDIPSFLNNHDIAWAYDNHKTSIINQVKPSERNPTQVSKTLVRKYVAVSKPSIRNPAQVSKPSLRNPLQQNKPSVSNSVPVSEPSVSNPLSVSKPSVRKPVQVSKPSVKMSVHASRSHTRNAVRAIKPSVIDFIPKSNMTMGNPIHTGIPSIQDIIPTSKRSRSETTSQKHKQYIQKGKVFGYCDIANDEDLDGLFPGLFQSEPEILSEANKVIKHERWHANTLRTYGSAKHKKPQVVEPTTQRFALTNNESEIQVTRPPAIGAPICKCCETFSQHEVYTNITIDEATFSVIQLPGKFQAFPVGRCPETNLCLHGGCVQHYSVHHVLIWNSSVPYWPPFDFASIEYPTHCTWENIGT